TLRRLRQRSAGTSVPASPAHKAGLQSRPPLTDNRPVFPIEPPVAPMLARLASEVPAEGAFLYEPKWDGFRAIVFRGGGDVFIQSRDLKPLDRYFPELHAALIDALPD